MTISDRAWTAYIEKLRAVSDAAFRDMMAYLNAHPWYASRQARVDAIAYAYGLATKYGEAAAELACQLYDAVSAAEMDAIEAAFAPAEPAATATYNEVAKAVQGTMKTGNAQTIAGSVSRVVKMAGVDTTMQNAIRDGAEWAWIPRGETCAFCLTLASRGWQRASRKALKGGHAEHIHANCDCTYAIRHDRRTDVAGYEPERYLAMYNSAPGSPTDKINAMRRAAYAENKANGLLALDSSVMEEIDI